MSETEKTAFSMECDDGMGTLTIRTPSGDHIVIGYTRDVLVVEDPRGNSARFDAEGITLKSTGNLTIHAQGDLSLSANGTIELSSTQEIKATGLNLTLAAQASLSATGGVSAELSAGGQTTIKGALVSIN